jgi:hypothetical protein
MILTEQLNYQAYEHQYKENDILVLKSIEDLNKVNKTLISFENHDAFINANWYLTKEKIKLLSNKKLRVLSCISWHMGIPFYNIEVIDDNSNILYIGEFYLDDEGSV